MDLGDRLGALRFLIRDRDPVFTSAFGEVCKAEGLAEFWNPAGEPATEAIAGTSTRSRAFPL
jgi:hypothetical protein